MKTITTVPELIEALGGFSRMAKWAGYEDYRGVHNWIARGIPPSYHLRLMIEARRQGVPVDPKVFGLEDDDAEVLRSIACQSKRKPHRAA